MLEGSVPGSVSVIVSGACCRGISFAISRLALLDRIDPSFPPFFPQLHLKYLHTFAI